MRNSNSLTDNIVKPKKLLLIVGVIGIVVFGVIWFFSVRSEGWDAWGFHVVYGLFVVLCIILILAYLNCRITYTDIDFTVRNMLGVSRTYRYDQITAIEYGQDIKLYIGKKKITIDMLSDGAGPFLLTANQQYSKINSKGYKRKNIPDAPRARDIFNGNIENGTAIFVIEAILLCGALAGAVSAYIGTGSSDGPLTKVMLTGFAVVLLIYTIGSVVVGRHIERYSKKTVNIFFKDPVIKSYKISNDKMMELWQIPWEELVVAMYDKGLDRLYGKPVNIVYNGDRDKRYIVTKVRKGYSYDFQRLHKLEKDEWFSMGSSEDDLPAEWEYLIEQESSKVYKSVDEAIQALKTEAEYKTYYAK